MSLKSRKPNRLENFDYNSDGAYFITISTRNREKILSDIVGEGLCALPLIKLSPIGKTVDESIKHLSEKYNSISVDKYVIMPNHIHLLIKIDNHQTGGHGDPPLHDIIGRFKSFTTVKYGTTLWQRSFCDHIIRNQTDYNEVWEYIDNNPIKWLETHR